MSIHHLSRSVRKILIVLWLFLLVTLGTKGIFDPSFFRPENLVALLQQFGPFLLLAYFLLSILRGFTLIPSMPFVVAGVLLFPDNLPFVYIISLAGILLSSTLIYYFSQEMGFDEYFEKHASYHRIEKWIRSHGFPFIFVWSFVPFLPTDLVCYIAGTVGVPYRRFILAVALGEALICFPIVFGMESLLAWIV